MGSKPTTITPPPRAPYRWRPQPRVRAAVLAWGPVADFRIAAGLSEVVLSGVFSGRCRATENVRDRISSVLGVSAADIFDDEPDVYVDPARLQGLPPLTDEDIAAIRRLLPKIRAEAKRHARAAG